MNTNEALLRYQQSNQNKNIFNNKEIKVNSKNQFLKYGTETTIISMFSNFPSFFNEKKEIIEIENKTSKLLALQQLERLLYSKGIAALKYDWTPAEVIDYVEADNELRYLKTKLEFITSKYTFYVFEEYQFKNNELCFEYIISKPENIEDNEVKNMLLNVFNYAPELKQIPYKLFYNNSKKSPDLDLVNDEYFKLMNNDLSVLMEDSYLSAPWIFASDTSNIKEKIQNGIHSLEERFISINPQVALYDPEPLRMLQGNSQAQQLIEKVEKNVAWIKKFAFMKQDSNNFGTKNMHNAEIQEINSDFEDYIEAKANLRELQLLEFANKVLNEKINKVLIFGSTEWIQTEAKKYAVDMNGSVINQNQLQQLESVETKDNGKTN